MAERAHDTWCELEELGRHASKETEDAIEKELMDVYNRKPEEAFALGILQSIRDFACHNYNEKSI